MPGYSAGIPVHKAIIVRHTPRDFGRAVGGRNTGAIPMNTASISKGLDYIGREGDFAERSDIEREPTTYDEVLLDDRLDYIGREGAYATRGADRQVDATYWDQHGPRDRASIEAEMRSAGGAYVDSIVTVGREYAEALGISTKEDMQRLLRATWSRNVERWGAIRNPEDIRWVACYHTDADRSVHAHIFTWSARGEIAPGYTVSREGTRAGKEEIYRVGYSCIRESRDVRRNLIRDLARFEALRQLGRSVPEQDERRIAATAARNGLPYRLSRDSDLSRQAASEARRMCERLEQTLKQGHGRLSGNWQANAIARDIVRLLERESPAFRALSEEHRACAELLADLKGYGDSGFQRERRALVNGEREDFLKRTSYGIVKGCVPRDAAGRTRGEQNRAYGRGPSLERGLMRDARRPLIAYKGPRSRDLVSRAYGIPLKQVRAMERDVSRMRRLLSQARGRVPEERRQECRSIAYDYAKHAASGSRFSERIAQVAFERSKRGGIDPKTAYDEVHGRFVHEFARTTMERIEREPAEPSRYDTPFSHTTLLELASVLESAARSLAYSAVRGGMRGERDRSLDRDRPDREPLL